MYFQTLFMANFNTHLGVSAVASGMLATLCLQVGFVDGKDALLLATAGVIGGILPDVDLHYSYPSRILFSLLGIVIAFLWVFSAKNQLSIAKLWVAGAGIYLIIRYPVWALFQNLTVHRGSVHSIGAAVLFALLASIVGYYLFSKTAFLSWFVALFVFAGFILHLVLDELYSVDFMGHRLKRSFGSALKLFDPKEKISSLVILTGILLAWFFTPDHKAFIDTLTSAETYRVIAQRFF